MSKFKANYTLYIYSIGLLCFLSACQKPSPQEPVVSVPVTLADSLPSPAHNPISREGVALGKLLFHDPALSGNNSISCATCHVQPLGYADGQTLSTLGSSQQALSRHTLPLINLAWRKELFWDGGVKNLESVAFAPLLHPDEMAQNLKELPQELRQRKEYRLRFKTVFGSDSITNAMIARALAQYQRTLISGNSKYDRFIKDAAGFSELELKGLELFTKNCSGCHPPPFFTDDDYHHIGLDSVYQEGALGILQGRFRITRDSTDMGKFRTPTLRNVTATAPYMHDGRYPTLQHVLNHYREKVLPVPSLDPALLQDPQKPGLSLSSTEQTALIAFLHTLTDSAFLYQPSSVK
ncbi:cytochrome c peroxidase [Rapidithrix thailandica]|uniref:Cytochrome c peroxidase n=1 Tax=Rapidithrix thailandica TaxID=413964 RepID=A0AAW9SDA9_9BACT